jgi:hypothetical protein
MFYSNNTTDTDDLGFGDQRKYLPVPPLTTTPCQMPEF